MRPDQLELVTTLSAPALSPDGERAVVSAAHPSFAADAAVGQLWLLDTRPGGAAPRRFTRGMSDAAPSFSPDGRLVAFLRRTAKSPQLAVVDARGGEPRVLTDRPLGVESFAWSPDSARIAFCARMPAAGRYGTLAGVEAGREDPRRITGFKHKSNGLGWTADRPVGIFLLQVPPPDEEPWVEPVGRAKRAEAGEPAAAGQGGFPPARLLTPPDRDATGPVFSPDGAHLYFTASLHPGSDRDLRTMVHRVPVDASGEEPGEPALVAGSAGADHSFHTPTFSRDGATLYLLGHGVGESGTDFVARDTAVFALEVARLEEALLAGAPAPAPVPLTDPATVGYAPVLAPAGEAGVLALAHVRGAHQVHRLTADRTLQVLAGGRRNVRGVAAAGETVAFAYADPHTPGEVAVLDSAAPGGVRTLTDFAAGLRAATRIAEPIELELPSADGYPVHGWVYLPTVDSPGPHPVLLNIHGGPHAAYGWEWFDEVQVMTAAGYAVVQCNPRGSASYGRAHGLAIKARMGTLDMQDVLAFLDGALRAVPGLDPDRVGIMGGSYGGYLTAWIIAHHHRWRGAIVERGYLDPLAFVGTSDIGWFFSEEYTGADPQHVRTQSPMEVVDRVATPTLVIHSEQDLRCPIEQAQRYFAALLRAGVASEFLVFPGEDHELSRSGSPWHRRQRFEAVLDWWGRHLPV